LSSIKDHSAVFLNHASLRKQLQEMKMAQGHASGYVNTDAAAMWQVAA
jgi:hypothetical protein